MCRSAIKSNEAINHAVYEITGLRNIFKQRKQLKTCDKDTESDVIPIDVNVCFGKITFCDNIAKNIYL